MTIYYDRLRAWRIYAAAPSPQTWHLYMAATARWKQAGRPVPAPSK